MTVKFITFSEEEFTDLVNEGGWGVCLKCTELASGVEPDAEFYECECCEKRAVFGLEQALLWGKINLV